MSRSRSHIMMKHTAIVTLLALGLIAPTVSAQATSASGTASHPRLQRVLRANGQRIRKGVRAGKIDTAELAKLRADKVALRGQIRELRQAGIKPTVEQRQAL